MYISDYGPIEVPSAPEGVATYDIYGPRLVITKIVNENFKSYAGVQTLGVFHKVIVRKTNFIIQNILIDL